jgi:hypothetical protein
LVLRFFGCEGAGNPFTCVSVAVGGGSDFIEITGSTEKFLCDDAQLTLDEDEFVSIIMDGIQLRGVVIRKTQQYNVDTSEPISGVVGRTVLFRGSDISQFIKDADICYGVGAWRKLIPEYSHLTELPATMGQLSSEGGRFPGDILVGVLFILLFSGSLEGPSCKDIVAVVIHAVELHDRVSLGVVRSLPYAGDRGE